jgi:hypothetical protein
MRCACVCCYVCAVSLLCVWSVWLCFVRCPPTISVRRQNSQDASHQWKMKCNRYCNVDQQLTTISLSLLLSTLPQLMSCINFHRPNISTREGRGGSDLLATWLSVSCCRRNVFIGALTITIISTHPHTSPHCRPRYPRSVPHARHRATDQPHSTLAQFVTNSIRVVNTRQFVQCTIIW